ncbi:MAG: bifunctional phosphoribosylaminoimidazolecarboxamide formyltransferase/IMP cyclohydrolase [Phycisphaerae bacterium]|nr:bifunctional phosphoribosylaminoimidazolecarboxamide formyltransferase/IMP cyclohydrolase [Phycisphaerae bacterium]
MTVEVPTKITRALLSVSDKTDLIPFARALADFGVELVSTGGTAATLSAAGIPVTPIEKLTGFPEILDGRVKTLHPAVHGGLLYRRDIPAHVQQASAHGIAPIDLVCVNLYPFERTIRKEGVREDEAIEQIDIGGPSMLRSAAKNFGAVTVVTSASQYDRVIEEMREHKGCTTLTLRREFASAVFARTAEYDAAIATWMSQRAGQGEDGPMRPFPDVLRLTYVAHGDLRYGENPHQLAAVYRDPSSNEPSVVTAELLAGKPLSYNNLLDASAALELVQDLRDLFGDQFAACVVKHTNPCGAAVAKTATEAFLRAYAGDPLAAYGGIVAVSGPIDVACAEAIATGDRFLEVIVAERFEPDAVRVLSERWKNARLLATGPLRPTPASATTYRSVPGGLLAQERDTRPTTPRDLTHSAGPEANDALAQDAAFLMTVVKHLKSNAVCIGADRQLFGAGAGQMDRLAACRNAVEKAGMRLRDPNVRPVAASDAFFPFDDGPKVLIDAGVKAIVHPGGSKRDGDTFALCNAKNVICWVTGVRHFRH